MKRKFRQLLSPYDAYKSSGPYIKPNGDGRMQINCMPMNGGKPYTGILYARYLLEVKLGRFLHQGYEVDHIDGDATNDMLNNLQELPAKLNACKWTKSSLQINAHCKSHVLARCLVCGKWFDIKRVKVYNSDGSQNVVSCSNRCRGILSHYTIRNINPIIEYTMVPESLAANMHPDFLMYSIELPYDASMECRCTDCGIILHGTKTKRCRKCSDVHKRTTIEQPKLASVVKWSIDTYGRINLTAMGNRLGITANGMKKVLIRKYGLDYVAVLATDYNI